ncbi:MAG: Trm112 family protein [Pseudomonadota bacterium]
MLDKKLLSLLVCPSTRGPLVLRDGELWSAAAGLAYPVRDGIPVLLEEQARPLDAAEIEQLRGRP